MGFGVGLLRQVLRSRRGIREVLAVLRFMRMNFDGCSSLDERSTTS